MAHKIIIQFSENPAEGLGFSYYNVINGYRLLYANGADEVLINYLPNGETETDFTYIAVETSLSETINKTVQRLKDYYVSEKVSYTRVSNTIEIFINVDSELFLTETSPSITTVTTLVAVIFPDLKYYIQWDDYFLGIRQKNYQGFSTEIFGSVILKKSNADNILDPIRGTGLSIDLEANPNLTFDEFLLADEMTYTVELKKGAKLIFSGFIKPDGVQQSYVSDLWVINIEAIDGLGALKDLSFVYPNGSQFVGKLSMFEIIRGCLDRTGSALTINSSIELEYNGYLGTNILKDTYLNSSRFLKNDGETIMDCNSVLTSVLNLLSAVITQENGQWWVYRPNDLKLNKPTEFVNNTTDTLFSINLNKSLGSQINGFYPHHCGANQQIEVEGAISAYRLNYEYGFNDGLLLNTDLRHDDNLNYEFYSKTNNFNNSTVVNIQNDNQGLIMNPIGAVELNPPNTSQNLKDILISDSITALKNTVFTLKGRVSSYAYLNYFTFRVLTSTGKYAKILENTWNETHPNFFAVVSGEYNLNSKTTNSFEISLPPIPEDCTIQIIICQPIALYIEQKALFEIEYLQLTDDTIKRAGLVGEFHTVSRKNPPSSITKENQTVYNGDGSNSLIGSIYKEDKTTLTDLWNRKGRFEKYPILRISAEDDLRIKRNAIKVFSGDIFGQLPYLSIVKINNILGTFMFTDYAYDFRSNILSAKLKQFYNDELGDIDYLISYDYGNNKIKPTIKG